MPKRGSLEGFLSNVEWSWAGEYCPRYIFPLTNIFVALPWEKLWGLKSEIRPILPSLENPYWAEILTEIDRIVLRQKAWAGSFGKRFRRSSLGRKWTEAEALNFLAHVALCYFCCRSLRKIPKLLQKTELLMEKSETSVFLLPKLKLSSPEALQKFRYFTEASDSVVFACPKLLLRPKQAKGHFVRSLDFDDQIAETCLACLAQNSGRCIWSSKSPPKVFRWFHILSPLVQPTPHITLVQLLSSGVFLSRDTVTGHGNSKQSLSS